MMTILRVAGLLALAAGVLIGCVAGAAAAGATAAGGTAGVVAGTDSGNVHACVDTPLTITFPSPPALGTTGSITAGLRFWEYGSVSLEGQPVDTSQRLACSRQLTAAEAAQWSDPAFVLNGWVPATVNATVSGASVSGATVSVNWSAPAGHSAADVIALCAVHAPWCVAAERAGTTASTGTASFPLPAGAGMYQARYCAHGRVTAVSAPFAVVS